MNGWLKSIGLVGEEDPGWIYGRIDHTHRERERGAGNDGDGAINKLPEDWQKQVWAFAF